MGSHGFPWPISNRSQAKTQRKITERRAAKGLAAATAEGTVGFQRRVAGSGTGLEHLGLGKAWETEGKPMENHGKPWKTMKLPGGLSLFCLLKSLGLAGNPTSF